MKILFVRHGKSDYTLADLRHLSYAEKNYCPLDSSALHMVEETAQDLRFKDADIILSSPFTRALQTAEILNRRLQKPLVVEYDLHEWAVSLDGSAVIDENETLRRYYEFRNLNGAVSAGKKLLYESAESVEKRGKAVLEKYKQYKKIIVVSHGTLIMCVTGIFGDVPLCGIVEYEFRND
ncbi:MAG: histidine phosphatase family protein [Spirochaetales bacterium]|nr:histidine phosphatase family protein [Spirochaetales bacterium]